ncbi:hypothetical protein JCM10908_002757 [Rhodotorula pacifica]|uniref:uncharacterized protein n=1 Tax=Rhodotorula pacifica TaxID=1495444 RepID=UPI00316D7119
MSASLDAPAAAEVMEDQPVFDASDEVWRCAPPCLFEIESGLCVGCGREYEITEVMQEFEEELQLENYPIAAPSSLPEGPFKRELDRCPSPWLTPADWAASWEDSPVKLVEDNPNLMQLLFRRGATAEMIERYDLEWDQLDGIVATLPEEDALPFADSFVFAEVDETDRLMYGRHVRPYEEDGPPIWRVALGSEVALVAADPDGEEFVHWQLDELLLACPQQFDRRSGHRPDVVTLLYESPDGPTEYYTRRVRRDEHFCNADGGLSLMLPDGTTVPIVLPMLGSAFIQAEGEEESEDEADYVVKIEEGEEDVAMDEEPSTAEDDDHNDTQPGDLGPQSSTDESMELDDDASDTRNALEAISLAQEGSAGSRPGCLRRLTSPGA